MTFDQQVALLKTLLDCHRINPIPTKNLEPVILLLIQTVGGFTASHVQGIPVLREAIKEFGFGGNRYYEEKYAN